MSELRRSCQKRVRSHDGLSTAGGADATVATAFGLVCWAQADQTGDGIARVAP